MASLAQWGKAVVESIRHGGYVSPDHVDAVREDRAFAETAARVGKAMQTGGKDSAAFLAENLRREGIDAVGKQPMEIANLVAGQLHRCGVTLPENASITDVGRGQSTAQNLQQTTSACKSR